MNINEYADKAGKDDDDNKTDNGDDEVDDNEYDNDGDNHNDSVDNDNANVVKVMMVAI